MKQESNLEWFWGQGASTRDIRESCELAAKKNVAVLIVGETGSGKELVAQYLYELRKKHWSLNPLEAPFIALNSAAIPEALTESMLFGHERGAFTSARERQYGKFEMARKGTLFLDEIQSLPLTIQPKLLRVLQTGEIDRLGGKGPIPVECQVIAASNIPLEMLMKQDLFRRDLYYRLNVCPMYLPPLRQRKEDIPLLVQGFLRRILQRHALRVNEVDPSAFDLIFNYEWPGNLRELEHALIYGALRCEGTLRAEHLPPQLTGKLSDYLQEGQWSRI